ncbi:MAG TPA: hypothetical protein DEB40_14455 [Elusimicrobia bacterium]|nr:hypothetical protein [Elusimicrobiota bacterium]HBT62935.1 hypothetical protein [Elusimicrobiota bacterium]
MDEAPPRNVLSVDVEEWYQTVLFDPGNVDLSLKTDLPRDVERILSMLAAFKAKATFFVLGCVAEKYPGLVESIASQGHEIASHGYSHRLVSSLSREGFGVELERSRAVLARRAGTEIAGYRASTWSIREDSGWAMEAIARAGFGYDSSIYPFSLRPRIAGGLDERRFPRRLNRGLWEFPPSTFGFCGWNLPFAGGTFLRFQALGSIQERIAKINALGMPALAYFHSWEFSHAPPAGIPAWKRALQFGNVRSVEKKMTALLRRFEFRTVRDLLFAPAGDSAGGGK